MGLSRLPQFTIEEVRPESSGDEAHLLGRLSHVRGVRNDSGCLFLLDDLPIYGSLDHVPTTARELVLLTTWDVALASRLRPGGSCPWVDGYWQPYHISMILAGRWERRTFSPRLARYFRLNGATGWQPDGMPLPAGARDLGVREGGWDHEHCELCRTHIGGPGNPLGAVDPEEHWLCTACYERYAVPRNLSFVVDD